MTFTCNSLTRCSGQNHWTFAVTVTSPNLGAKTFTVPLSEMQDSIQDWEEALARAIIRLRSAMKEAGAANFTQARTAVEGKTFQI